jgi:hypothetical protein
MAQANERLIRQSWQHEAIRQSVNHPVIVPGLFLSPLIENESQLQQSPGPLIENESQLQ